MPKKLVKTSCSRRGNFGYNMLMKVSRPNIRSAVSCWLLATAAMFSQFAYGAAVNMLSCCPGEDTATEARFVWHSDSDSCLLFCAKASNPAKVYTIVPYAKKNKPVAFRSADVAYYKYEAKVSDLEKDDDVQQEERGPRGADKLVRQSRHIAARQVPLPRRLPDFRTRSSPTPISSTSTSPAAKPPRRRFHFQAKLLPPSSAQRSKNSESIDGLLRKNEPNP